MPISKKKGWYYVKIMEGGVIYTPSKVGIEPRRCKTQKEARTLETKLREKVQEIKEMKTVLDCLTASNHYLDNQQGRFHGKDTFAQKQRFCKDFVRDFGRTVLAEIAVHHIQGFLDGRAEKVSANNYNIYRKEGRCFYNWLIRQGYLPPNSINPFSMTDKLYHKSVKTGPAPLGDVIKVLEAANPDQRDLLEAVLRTGARIGEIVNLQWCDIDLDNRIYRLKTRKTKGGEQKTTAHAMSDSLYRIFKRRAENKHSDVPYVFWHEFYSRKTKTWRCDKYQSLGRFTERVCKKAGVKRFGLHQLRHLSASILKDEGNMSISQLQKFLRHEDQKTTEIYANHLDNETLETTTFLNKYLDKKLKTGAAGV